MAISIWDLLFSCLLCLVIGWIILVVSISPSPSSLILRFALQGHSLWYAQLPWMAVV